MYKVTSTKQGLMMPDATGKYERWSTGTKTITDERYEQLKLIIEQLGHFVTAVQTSVDAVELVAEPVVVEPVVDETVIDEPQEEQAEEKPKRKRRTQAQIEADKLDEEQEKAAE